MMLPLSVANHLSVQGNNQVSSSILPGQTDAGLTDEQKGGYDLDMAALLLQLQPAELAATPLPTATTLPDELPAQTTILPDQTPILMSMPLQHFSQPVGDYQLNLPVSSIGLMAETAEVAALLPPQPLSVSATIVEADGVKALINTGVVAPTAVAGASSSLSFAAGTPVPATPSALVAATENAALLQMPNAGLSRVSPALGGFTASEREPMTAITLLERLKTPMSAQPVQVNPAHSQPLSTTTSQHQQQAVFHTVNLNQAMLAAQLQNPQSGVEVSQPAQQQSALSAALAAPPSASYQWQSEPMPAEPVRFGQRLLALLSDKVDVQLGLGVNKATIRLDPPSLGSIELAVQQDGEKLTVHLNSSNAQLKEAMQQGLEQLRASLQLRLGSDAQIELRMGPDTQSQQQREQQAQAQGEIAANIAGVEQVEDVDTAQRAAMGLVNQLV